MIWILTLANKPEYLPDALESVKNQTRRDFTHIVHLDDGSRDWEGRYPPAVWFNEQAKAIPNGKDYLCWLSDDDVWLPNYLRDMAGFLDAHPEVQCCYGITQGIFLEADGSTSHYLWLPEMSPVFSAEYLPLCKLDGGQFMVRRWVLDLIPYPYIPETSEPEVARVADGLFLNKIAIRVGIHPIGKHVMTNRITPLSAHCRPGRGQRDIVDWRTAGKWK